MILATPKQEDLAPAMTLELAQPIQCLNHGFIRLVDRMGDDGAIVQAARVSYGKGTKTNLEDAGLINYLMRHQHATPFEMVEFKFHAKMPIFVARQFIRHRTANVNEYSGRYSELIDEFYVPDLDRLQTQAIDNKQGSGEPLPLGVAKELQSDMMDEVEADFRDYKSKLGRGLSRELSRINMPVSGYTEWYWKCDLRNIFNFLRLRLDSHAQYEIRVYAEAMAEIVQKVCPIAWEAFEDYVLGSVTFSAKELATLPTALKLLGDADDWWELNQERSGMSKGEWKEFREKVRSVRNIAGK